MACQHSGCDFVSWGSSERVAKVNLQRHVRECHASNAEATRQHRQMQQRSRLAASRLARNAVVSLSRSSGGTEQVERPVLKRPSSTLERPGAVLKRPSAVVQRPAAAPKHLFVVTAPNSRTDFWEKAREELLQAGIPVENICRRKGLDFTEYSRPDSPLPRDGRYPPGLKRHTFLHFDFIEHFLPWCKDRFEKRDSVQVIWWVEDDIKMKMGASQVHEKLELTLQQEHCLLWAGYTKKGATPRFGSHLVGVTRVGFDRLLDFVRDSRSSGVREVGDHLKGLDTWLWQLVDRSSDENKLCKTAAETWAGQVRHTRAGRR